MLYFDRKEKFYSILRKVWKHKDQGRGVWWASYVTQLSEIDDMRNRPEIQAADLFAWLANRYHTHGTEDRWGWHLFRTLIIKSHYHQLINQEGLDCLYDGDGKMKANAKLPPTLVKPPGGTALQVAL